MYIRREKEKYRSIETLMLEEKAYKMQKNFKVAPTAIFREKCKKKV